MDAKRTLTLELDAREYEILLERFIGDDGAVLELRPAGAVRGPGACETATGILEALESAWRDAPVSVLQPWVTRLTLMQQGVLMAAVRGPDGLRKNHVSKIVLRWFRRCIFVMAFERKIFSATLKDAFRPGGGSFTGPCVAPDTVRNVPTGMFLFIPDESDDAPHYEAALDFVVDEYLRHVDEMPHHFQLHLMHAAQVLAYKHPYLVVRAWWLKTYLRLVNDLHLAPESEERMNWRLGDDRENWLRAEEVTAR